MSRVHVATVRPMVRDGSAARQAQTLPRHRAAERGEQVNKRKRLIVWWAETLKADGFCLEFVRIFLNENGVPNDD